MNRRLLLSVLGLCLAIGFAGLGRWQLGRGLQKEALLAEAAAALAAPPAPLGPATHDATSRPQRVQGAGTFMPAPRLWLDNQRRGPRVGVRLYCAFQPEQGQALLVDLGWLPLGPARELPAAACPQGGHVLAGLLVPPPAVGLRLGPGLVEDRAAGAWLATRLEPAEVSKAWSLPAPLAPRVLRLDPALPLGHERDLELLSNTLPPEKHRGYALQWFGLALATLITTVLLLLRRRP